MHSKCFIIIYIIYKVNKLKKFQIIISDQLNFQELIYDNLLCMYLFM